MALAWQPWRENQQVRNAETNSPSMKSGTSGQHVHLLQASLIINGFNVPHHGITGNPPQQNNNYLAETSAAVRALQLRFNLTRDQGVSGREVVTTLDRESDKFYRDNTGRFGAALARTDVPRALMKVSIALASLTALRNNISPVPGIPVFPIDTALINTTLRVHFRLLPPGVPVDGVRQTRTFADLDRIIQTYRDIAGLFAAAATAFEDAIPVNGVRIAAEALTGSRRIQFGPAFCDFDSPFADRIGPESRAAILIHEGMHAVDTSNRSGDRNVHISEFDPAYNNQPPNLSLFNPSSYASYASHIVLQRDPDPRHGLDPRTRRPGRTIDSP